MVPLLNFFEATAEVVEELLAAHRTCISARANLIKSVRFEIIFSVLQRILLFLLIIACSHHLDSPQTPLYALIKNHNFWVFLPSMLDYSAKVDSQGHSCVISTR